MGILASSFDAVQYMLSLQYETNQLPQGVENDNHEIFTQIVEYVGYLLTSQEVLPWHNALE